MTPDEYIKNALKTEIEKYNFVGTNGVTPRAEHAVYGLITEAGELIQALKRAKIYGKQLDTINVIEELGDIMWYLALYCDEIGVSFEEIWDKNIRKLMTRYPERYTKRRAIVRNLIKERETLEK